MQHFAYNWKFPAYSGVFLLAIDNFSLFAYNWSSFAYSGKVRLIRALRDCKQRNLTVSKKARAVSKQASPKSTYPVKEGKMASLRAICEFEVILTFSGYFLQAAYL